MSRSEKSGYGSSSSNAWSTDVLETGSSCMISGTQPCAIDSYIRVEKPMPDGARQNLDCCITARYSRGPICLCLPASLSPRRSRRKKPAVSLYRR